jgi:hypothetical protein
MYPRTNQLLQDMQYGTGSFGPQPTQPGQSVPVNRGTYWRGADGNVWVAGSDGTNSAGTWDDNSQNYWNSQGYTLQSDPNAYSSANEGIGGSGYTTGTSGITAQDRDYLNSQINQVNWGIGQLDPQLQVAKDNIGTQYNAAFNKLQGGFNTAQGQYGELKDQIGQDYQKAGSNIDVSVGAGNRSLKRLLGRFGAGSSSAAKVLAPYAAGKQGARQRGEVADQFVVNNTNADQGWNQYKTNYDQEVSGLSDWKRNQENQATADVNSRRASFLQQLGGIQSQLSGSVAAANPYISQAQGLLSGLTDLGRQYNTAANVKAPTYQRADTSPYEFSRAGAPTLGENVAIQDAVNPYASLFGQKDKKLKVSY